VGNVFSTGKNPQFYAPPGQPPPYPPNVCGYSCGNVSQAELNDPAALTKESYDFSFSALRESVGVAVQWLAPLGLFRFSLAVPLNAQHEIDGVTWGDQTERFQFSVGQAF
jgi:outer membrane protein insertion porin family